MLNSAKGCATCTWLEGATTCGVIQCYPMASGVESQGGPRGSTTHGPPPLPAYPSPRPRKIAIILCVCVCRYTIVRIKFFLRWAPPLIKILYPPLTSYPKKNPAWPGPHNWPGPRGTSPPPLPSRVEVNHHDIRLEDLCFSIQCQRLYQKHCKPH